MAPVLKLETPDGIFTKDMSGNVHFAIDCICGGKSGSHYKNASSQLEEQTEGYESRDKSEKFKHTYFMTEFLLQMGLSEEHNEKNGQEPLVIVCNDCSKEFPFTIQSYWDLGRKMINEYNKRTFE